MGRAYRLQLVHIGCGAVRISVAACAYWLRWAAHIGCSLCILAAIQLQACVYIHTDHAAIAMDVAQIPEWPVSSARVVVVLVGTTHCDCVVFDVAVSSI